MILAAATATLLLTLAEDSRQKALDMAQATMERRQAVKDAVLCMNVTALDFAEFSQEPAALAGSYAVRFCKESIAKGTPDLNLLPGILEELERDYAEKIALWRVMAAKDGSYAEVRKMIMSAK